MKKSLIFLVPLALLAVYWVYIQDAFTAIDTPSVIQKHTLTSEFLDREVSIWVYLPPNYMQTDKPYRSIYMHDGQNLFHDSLAFAGEWKIDEKLDSLYALTNQRWIAIGIENGGEKRIDELTPYVHEKYGGGKGENYLQFIKSELIPYVEANFHVSTQPTDRAMIGSSLGGLITFYEAMQPSATFSKFGVYSPSFWYNDSVYVQAQSAPFKDPLRMVLLAGEQEEDTHFHVLKMDSILDTKSNVSTKVEIHAEGKHSEWFWSREFAEDVLWLFQSRS